MSRSYLIMVGGDLLLAISLLVVVNILIIGSVIGPELFPILDPVQLGTMCLSLLVAKYTLRLYRFYRNDKVEFKKSFMRIVTASLLPVTFFIFYVVSPDARLPAEVLELTLISFCIIQVLIFYRVFLADNIEQNKENLLILGAGPLAMQVTDAIADSGEQYNFCGYVLPEKTVEAERIEYPVATAGQILQTVKKNKISKIVVALSERRGVLPVREMFSCKLRGVEVVDAVTL